MLVSPSVVCESSVITDLVSAIGCFGSFKSEVLFKRNDIKLWKL